jgi:hypothetical protein
MFTLFTPSHFGRSVSCNIASQSDLATYLAAYRRNRAKTRNQSAIAAAPVARAA